MTFLDTKGFDTVAESTGYALGASELLIELLRMYHSAA